MRIGQGLVDPADVYTRFEFSEYNYPDQDPAVSFGKDKGWVIVMLFLLGFRGLPMLAFRKSSDQGIVVKA